VLFCYEYHLNKLEQQISPIVRPMYI